MTLRAQWTRYCDYWDPRLDEAVWYSDDQQRAIAYSPLLSVFVFRRRIQNRTWKQGTIMPIVGELASCKQVQEEARKWLSPEKRDEYVFGTPLPLKCPRMSAAGAGVPKHKRQLPIFIGGCDSPRK